MQDALYLSALHTPPPAPQANIEDVYFGKSN